MKSFMGVTKLITILSVVVVLASCGGAEERKVKYLEKGKAYLAEKNYDKAKVEFKNVLQIDPKFADAYFYMGNLEEANREIGKAVGNYRKAIELRADYTEPKIRLAKLYLMVGTSEIVNELKKLLDQIKAEGGWSPEVELISSTMEYKIGSKTKAVAALESLVLNDAHLVEAIGLLSNIYITEGKDGKAEELLKRGAQNNPLDIALKDALAKLLTKHEKYDEAETYLKDIIEIAPDIYQFRVTLANFYTQQGKLDQSEIVLRQAINDNPKDATRYLVLVEFYMTKVSIEKAFTELTKAIESKPDLYGLRFVLVQMYEKTGRIEDAVAALKKIITEKSLDPEGVSARNKLADLLFKTKDYLGAKEYLDQVLVEYPNNNDALLISAKLALNDDDSLTAINNLRTVVKNSPKNSEASLLLAKAHEINNQSDLAEAELKRSIEANPLDYNSHLNYANFLASKKREAESLQVVDTALSYFKNNYELLDFKLKLVASNNNEADIVSVLNAMRLAAPQRFEVYFKQGQYYVAKKQYDKALVEFDLALARTANAYPVLEQIVKTHVLQKNPELAIEFLDKRLQKNTKDVFSEVLLGKLYLMKKDIAKSHGYFNDAITNAKLWDEPYKQLAASFLLQKDTASAIKVYEQAIENVLDKAGIYMQLAGIYERDKNYSNAMKTYRRLLADNPDNKLAKNNLASLLLDNGVDADDKEALLLTEGFEKINQPALQDTLAWAYVKSGQHEKAITLLSDIVQKAPNIAVFQYHLGYAMFHSGDKVNAKKYIEMASSSDQEYVGKDNAKKLYSNY